MRYHSSLLVLAALLFTSPIKSASPNFSVQFEHVGPYGGDVRSLLIDSRGNGQVYLGTSDGRIFKSLDGGTTWSVLYPGIGRRHLVIERLVQHPSEPERIYACAWDLKSTGGGLFESLDGGITWEQVPLPDQAPAVRDLAISNSDPSHMIVGTLGGVYLSADGGKTWKPAGNGADKVKSVAIDLRNPDYVYIGTYRLGYRSSDFGATWSDMNRGIPLDSDLFSIAIDGTSPENLFVSACSGVYRSADRGASWTRLKVHPERLTIRAQIVLVDPRSTGRVLTGTTEGLYLSANDGSTWRRISPPGVIVNSLALDPRNPRRILLGSEHQGVLRSEDGGQSWIPSNEGFARRPVSMIVSDPQVPGSYLANVSPSVRDAAFYRFESGQKKWSPLSDRPGSGLKVHSLLSLPSKLGRIVGTDKGIYLQRNGSARWLKLTGPVGIRTIYELLFDQRNSWILAATDAGVYRARPKDLQFRIPDDEHIIPEVMSIVTSTADSDTLYAASSVGVLRSTDQGATWQVASAGIPLRAVVNCIAPCPRHRGHLLAGTTLGLYGSVDGGRTWEKFGDGRLSVDIPSVIFADREGKRIIVADGTFGGVFLSTSEGSQWNKIVAGEFSAPVRCITQDPQDPSSFYLGTSYDGVYRVLLLDGDLAGG